MAHPEIVWLEAGQTLLDFPTAIGGSYTNGLNKTALKSHPIPGLTSMGRSLQTGPLLFDVINLTVGMISPIFVQDGCCFLQQLFGVKLSDKALAGFFGRF